MINEFVFKVDDVSVKDINKITDALRIAGGVDFSDYAFSSFKRRIIRFMEINRIRDVAVFAENIHSDKGYASKVVEEITVNVTEMFRDPSFWMALRDNVLPKLAEKRIINIWHAACSTGEEVLSMAIMLKESNLLNSARIIATDLNHSVLGIAKKGVYSLRNQEVNGKNYKLFGGKGELSDYYSVNGNDVEFNKELFSGVDFRYHDLTADDPVTLFDLVLCRNVLIYFNFDLQERVLSTISRSMNPGSFLAIGSKESIRWCRESQCFSEVSMEEKIYRKTTGKIFML